MLKRAAEEPLGHAAAMITDVLENAETNNVINASQKRALLHEMALRLSQKIFLLHPVITGFVVVILSMFYTPSVFSFSKVMSKLPAAPEAGLYIMNINTTHQQKE